MELKSLTDFLGSAGTVAGNIFTARAQADAAEAQAAQSGNLALLSQQQAANRDMLNAQTTQRTTMYVALAIGAVALIVLFNKRIG